MSNIPISSLPIAIALDGSEEVPIVQGGATKRTTTAEIGNTASGFIPITATLTTPTPGGITGGGLLSSDLVLNFAPANLTSKSEMVVADTFAINDSALTTPAQVTFPNAMKALTGLPALGSPDLTTDFLIINRALDGLTYKISPSSLSLATGNVPAGGTTGQFLAKATGTDYDTQWDSFGNTFAYSGSTIQTIAGTGDVSWSADSFVTSIGNNKVTNAMLRQSVGLSVIGRASSSTGDVADIVATAAQVLRADNAGTTVGFGSIDLSQSGTVGASVLAAGNGGTGFASYAVGDLIYAGTTASFSKLSDVATGNALLSGGAGVAPTYGKIGLTTHVSGVLPAANGGTGVANANTITLGGDIATAGALTTAGAFASTFTMTGITSVTFPTSGTLATTSGASIPAIAQGDLLYGSASSTLSALSKDTNATRYLSNTGTSNNPAWAQVSLTSGVANTLPVANGGTNASSASGTALDNITAFSSTGILARTGAGTYAFRTVTGTSNVITVTNGDGVSGNPTLTTGSLVLRTDTTATVTIGYTVTPNNLGTISTGTVTPSAANGNYQYYTNNGAHTLAAPAADSAIDILITNGASAGAITFSGFTVGSSTGSALTTTNTNKFIISIRRINGVSAYSIYALQ